MSDCRVLHRRFAAGAGPFALAAVVLVGAGGCERPASAPNAEPPPPVAAALTPVEAEPPPSRRIPAETQEAPPPEQPPAERILILTPSGPVLMAARLTIDGAPLNEAADRLVAELLQAAREDDAPAGEPTWKRLMANDAYLKSQSPGGQSPSASERKMWIERYDLNRDGKMARQEAAAWLGRDARQGSQPLALRSSRSYRPEVRAESRLWPLLDADGDSLLTSDELHGAPDRLLALDANDDRLLTPVEMASLAEQLAVSSGGAPTFRASKSYAAIHLEPDADMARVDYLLNDLYAPRQDLQPASFRDFSALGVQLDANHDDWLQRSELARLLEVEPHVEVKIDFAATPGSDDSGVSVQLTGHTHDVAVDEALPGRLMIKAGATGLVVSAHDLRSAEGSDSGVAARAAVERRQVRLMVHDQFDGLYQALDGDGDGRLGAREIATSAARLVSCDADGDGQLRGDELPYVMVIAFLRGEPGDEQGFYVPPSPPTAPDLNAQPAWYCDADFNGDGDVSRREFLGPPELFDELDRNQDGFLEPGEAIEQAGAENSVE